MLPLPDTHRRAIQDCLAFVEQGINLIAAIVDGRQHDGIFTPLVDDLTPGNVRQLSSQIEAVRIELQRAKKELALHAAPESRQTAIERHLSEISGALDDARPHRLQRLGELEPAQALLLDTLITRLLSRIGDLRSQPLDTEPR